MKPLHVSTELPKNEVEKSIAESTGLNSLAGPSIVTFKGGLIQYEPTALEKEEAAAVSIQAQRLNAALVFCGFQELFSSGTV